MGENILPKAQIWASTALHLQIMEYFQREVSSKYI